MLLWLSVSSSRVVFVGEVVLGDGVSCGRTGDVQATVVPWLIEPRHTGNTKKQTCYIIKRCCKYFKIKILEQQV